MLDVILLRHPWFTDSQAVWQANHISRIDGYLVAATVTNIFYIARRKIGTAKARLAVGVCLAAFEVLPVTKVELLRADSLPGSDFEDNLAIACAEMAGLDAIVTRDAAGFTASRLPVLSPADLLAKLPP